MVLNIGANIKRLRLAKRLTQEQLAKLLNISTAAISKWEAKNIYPDITMLYPLAEIFNVSIDELLGYDQLKIKADIDNLILEYQKFCLKYRLRLYFKANFQSAAKIFDFGEISIELCFRRLSPHTALRCL